jgi:DNA primase
MSYIDIEYVNLVSSRLQKFSRKKDNLYTFRCPYCGDSKKNQNKTRGFFYFKKNDVLFKCHNCGVGRTLCNFLKDNSIDLHDKYILERYKEGLTGKSTNTPTPTFNFQEPKFSSKNQNSETVKILDLPTVESLNTTHQAKQYLINRKIPQKFFSKLYFVEDYNAWTETKTKIKDPRIIIPLLDKEGNLFGYQARSLNKNSKLRYITTILDKRNTKLFGLDSIDVSQDVYVTEGPFDSMFLDNSIAMCGSDVSLDKSLIPNRIFVFDNEPRNKQIMEKYGKCIDDGERIVIWPSSIKEKDINDMILAGHDVHSVIKSNTFSGLESKVKLNAWKKV